MGWGSSTCWSLILSPVGPEPSASQLPCLLKRRLISFDSQACLQMRGDFSDSPVLGLCLPMQGVHWSGQGAKTSHASQPKKSKTKQKRYCNNEDLKKKKSNERRKAETHVRPTHCWNSDNWELLMDPGAEKEFSRNRWRRTEKGPPF